MTSESFLSQLQGDRVEHHKMTYKGVEYAKPYQTIFLNGEEISGLREMKSRFDLIKSIFDENSIKYDSYLDIGCNLSYFPYRFSSHFKKVQGIEGDSYYVNLVKQLYPSLNILHNNLNDKPLREIIAAPVECITALSMIEYINNKDSFIKDLYNLSQNLVIVEGHSLDINSGKDIYYESLLNKQPWTVTRHSILTDNGINAPKEAKGRPLWICKK